MLFMFYVVMDDDEVNLLILKIFLCWVGPYVVGVQGIDDLLVAEHSAVGLLGGFYLPHQ